MSFNPTQLAFCVNVVIPPAVTNAWSGLATYLNHDAMLPIFSASAPGAEIPMILCL
jgi:hypothetical protein